MADVFRFLTEVTKTKEHSMSAQPDLEKEYIPFFTNRGLSQHYDTIFYANAMNTRWADLDNRMQYDYYFFKVRQAGRYGKWAKREKKDLIELLSSYFQCSYKKAMEISRILNTTEIKNIQDTMKNNKKEEVDSG